MLIGMLRHFPQLDPRVPKPLHETLDELVAQFGERVGPLEVRRDPKHVWTTKVLLDGPDDNDRALVFCLGVFRNQHVV